MRFFEAKLLDTVQCKSCSGRYVLHTMDLHRDYVCGLCNVPSRAGKTRKNVASAPLADTVSAPLPEPHEFALQTAMSRVAKPARAVYPE